MRWARRAFHDDEIDYDAVVGMAEAASSMREASSLRLASGHNAGHVHRAVMEGVAFAARRDLSALERRTGTINSIVAAAGGARGV